ncbi:MAG: aminotransferase class I/II-fold pyridoxal phosphate-dependent enzyme [Anaerolineaceae bacterium]|nr:aminotransferase class I/II-fold pyridoxal phosphate-dependent enzyme [Anaerolineaceae bacterium]
MSRHKPGISTIVTHHAEESNDLGAHVTPIYQTSAFRFPDVETGASIFQNQHPGYYYTRIENPNQRQVVSKIAALEAIDLPSDVASETGTPLDGHLFSSGMAAVTAAVLGCLKSGDKLIAHQNLYGATYSLLHHLAEEYKIQVIWLKSGDVTEWEQAFQAHPDARLAYAETPTNPNLSLVDLQAVAIIAHQSNAWLLVDNTFASPYCQRPFNLGADIVLHSTTKYLCGHGTIIGGVVLSRHLEWVKERLWNQLKLYGGSPSPFDAWLTQLGLKTYELRMARHCENATTIARWLLEHPKIGRVFYPGLPEHPGHDIAKRQMLAYGGMLACELKGGYQAGIHFMNHVKLFALVPTLGNVDSLIQHPASMSHVNVPQADRLKAGITDGLVRLSVGIENVEDLLDDLSQALEKI